MTSEVVPTPWVGITTKNNNKMVGNGPETYEGASGSVVTRETMPGAGGDAAKHPLQLDLKSEASLGVSVSNTGLPNRRMAHGPSHKLNHLLKHVFRQTVSNIFNVTIVTHLTSQRAAALSPLASSHPVAPPWEMAANSNFKSEQIFAQIICSMGLTDVEFYPESNALDFSQIGQETAEILPILLKKAANLNFKSDIKISQILQPRRLIDVEFCHEFNAIDFNQIGQELAERSLFLHSLCTRCSFGFTQKAANLNFKSDIKISQISQPRSLIGVEFRPESNAIDFNQIGQELAEISLFLHSLCTHCSCGFAQKAKKFKFYDMFIHVSYLSEKCFFNTSSLIGITSNHVITIRLVSRRSREGYQLI
jgi:hypothetical protein